MKGSNRVHPCVRPRWTRAKKCLDSVDMPWKGEGWWKHKEEKLRVYSEVSKLGWYWLVHGLLGMADDPPWSIELKQRYQSWLTAWVDG